jgi:flagellar hook-length control protein FliK
MPAIIALIAPPSPPLPSARAPAAPGPQPAFEQALENARQRAEETPVDRAKPKPQERTKQSSTAQPQQDEQRAEDPSQASETPIAVEPESSGKPEAQAPEAEGEAAPAVPPTDEAPATVTIAFPPDVNSPALVIAAVDSCEPAAVDSAPDGAPAEASQADAFASQKGVAVAMQSAPTDEGRAAPTIPAPTAAPSGPAAPPKPSAPSGVSIESRPDPAQSPKPVTQTAAKSPIGEGEQEHPTQPRPDLRAADASTSVQPEPPPSANSFGSHLVSGLTPTGPEAQGPRATAPPAPAAPNPPAVDVQLAPTDVAGVATSIRGHLLPQGGTMRIRLDPPELGVLEIRVDLRQGAMAASFETSTEHAARLVSHTLDQLRQTLESQGVNVEKLQVQHTPRDQHTSRGDEDDSRQRRPDDEAARHEQQRRQLLGRLWRRLAGDRDPLDLVA